MALFGSICMILVILFVGGTVLKMIGMVEIFNRGVGDCPSNGLSIFLAICAIAVLFVGGSLLYKVWQYMPSIHITVS